MAKIAVIDWSFLTHRIWSALPTKKVPWTRPTEAEEGIHRICEWVYALYTEHAWDRLIIAMDTPGYWRHEFLSDWHIKIPRYTLDGKFYTHYNACAWLIEKKQDEETKLWGATLTKLDAKEEKRVMKSWTLLETWPEDMPEPSWPKYKGNRHKEDSWACETDLKTFYDIRSRLAERIALLVKGKVVGYKGAEADDIAAVVATMGKHDVLLLSGDADWAQLVAKFTNVTLHNLYNNERVAPEFGTDMLRTQILIDFMVKIVGGDTGDNIKGVPYNDNRKRTCIAKKGASDLLKSCTIPEFKEKVFPLLNRKYLDKNLKMMSLTQQQIPPHIWTGIHEALKAPAKQYSTTWDWDQLGLTAKERERVEVSGGASRIFTQWMSQPKAIAEDLKDENS